MLASSTTDLAAASPAGADCVQEAAEYPTVLSPVHERSCMQNAQLTSLNRLMNTPLESAAATDGSSDPAAMQNFSHTFNEPECSPDVADSMHAPASPVAAARSSSPAKLFEHSRLWAADTSFPYSSCSMTELLAAHSASLLDHPDMAWLLEPPIQNSYQSAECKGIVPMAAMGAGSTQNRSALLAPSESGMQVHDDTAQSLPIMQPSAGAGADACFPECTAQASQQQQEHGRTNLHRTAALHTAMPTSSTEQQQALPHEADQASSGQDLLNIVFGNAKSTPETALAGVTAASTLCLQPVGQGKCTTTTAAENASNKGDRLDVWLSTGVLPADKLQVNEVDCQHQPSLCSNGASGDNDCPQLKSSPQISNGLGPQSPPQLNVSTDVEMSHQHEAHDHRVSLVQESFEAHDTVAGLQAFLKCVAESSQSQVLA